MSRLLFLNVAYASHMFNCTTSFRRLYQAEELIQAKIRKEDEEEKFIHSFFVIFVT